MSTRRSISITFHNAMQQATELSECASELDRAQQQLADIVSNLNTGWKGETATLYLQKCEALRSKLSKTSSNLSQVSAVVKRSAKSYYDAEMRALELAQQRSSGGGGR